MSQIKSAFFICICFALLILFKYQPFYNYSLYKICKIASIDENIIENEELSSSTGTYPTIFCLIKTHPKNIAINKTINVYNIWGRKCDNYRFVTLIPKALIPSNINTNETFEIFDKFFMIQPKSLVTETHDRLTLKVYYAMIYVYEKFPNYDWYHIVDDDAYVNIMNYKDFLRDKNPKDPITFGYDINLFVPGGYHSGGPGYGLSNEAFIRVGKALKENIKNCPDSGIDDVDINACVRKYGGKRGKSCDEEGRERFLIMDLKTHLKGNYHQWLYKHSGNKIKHGIDCCADSFIAVHYMQAAEVFRLDLAVETHRNIMNSFKSKKNVSLAIKFRDIARTYLMLEDIELGTREYEKYMNNTN